MYCLNSLIYWNLKYHITTVLFATKPCLITNNQPHMQPFMSRSVQS